mgnify:CR=1 FL=1
MKIRKVVCMLTLSTLLVSGCTSYQKSLYLQNEQVLNESLEGQLYDFRIMPKDELTILVSTTDPEASAPFYRKIGQSKEGSSNNTVGMQDAKLLAYLVDNQGCIDFPVLGNLKVMGLTNRECEALIREKLQPYLKEVPNVTVRTSNYKFSVLGEVNAPGTYTTDAEKVTIFEAFGGRIADTPGFASLEANRAGFIPKENLEHAFPEFGPYLGQCQFTGCSHRTEKGCAVRQALAEGKLSQTRYDSYCAMYDEVKDLSLIHI